MNSLRKCGAALLHLREAKDRSRALSLVKHWLTGAETSTGVDVVRDEGFEGSYFVLKLTPRRSTACSATIGFIGGLWDLSLDERPVLDTGDVGSDHEHVFRILDAVRLGKVRLHETLLRYSFVFGYDNLEEEVRRFQSARMMARVLGNLHWPDRKLSRSYEPW